MNVPVRLYLAGKICKDASPSSQSSWRSEYARALSSLNNVVLVSPEKVNFPRSNGQMVFGFACSLIEHCDAVVVNASQKLGVGSSQEILIAKYFGKYVITVLPKGTPHRRRDVLLNDPYSTTSPDWIHPFLENTSDVIIDDVSSLLHVLRENSELWRRPPKSLSLIRDAANYYDSSATTARRDGIPEFAVM